MPSSTPAPAATTGGAWFTRRGTFERSDGRAVRRYACRDCGRCFSDQTFRFDYRARLEGIDAPLRDLLARGTSVRAASRLLGVDRKSVRRRARRMGMGDPAARLALGAERPSVMGAARPSVMGAERPSVMSAERPSGMAAGRASVDDRQAPAAPRAS